MPYGTIKVDTVTFTDAGVDKSVSISGLVQNPTFSGNVTVTGTISGVTVTGTTASFTSGNFTNISGGTHTITSGVFATGSAANPSISFTSDPNTGIYSPGADQVAISTNGTGRLFVDANGNVGVGTSTPNTTGYGGSVLGIFAASNAGGNIWLTSDASAAGNRTGRIGFGTTSNTSQETARIWSLTEGSTASNLGGNLVFNTKADGGGLTERLRITSAGLVGLGTSSVSALFHAKGAGGSATGTELLRLETGQATGGNWISFWDGSARKGYIGYKETADENIYITNEEPGGNVIISGSAKLGVGTSTPQALLTSYPGNVSTLGAKTSTGLFIENNGNIGNISQIGLGYTFSSTYHPISIAAVTTSGSGSTRADLVFAVRDLTTDVAPTERLRITSDGKVGLGVSAPGALLHIAEVAAGSGFSATSLRSTRSNFGAEFTGYIDQGVSHGAIISTVSAGTATERIRITDAGRVGVGTTSPGHALDVVGSINTPDTNGTRIGFKVGDTFTASTTAAHYGLTFGAAGSNTVGLSGYNGVGFYTFGLERGRFDSSGRLLVGTSSARTGFQVSTGFGSVTPVHQFEFNSQTYNGLSITHNAGANTYPAVLAFGKSRGSSAGSYTAVASGDGLGWLDFYGADGTNMVRAATISAEVDGTPGANDMPGRLVFYTTADGSTSPTERMRITNNGYLKVSNNGTYINSASSYHEIRTTTNNTVTLYTQSAAANGQQYGVLIETVNDQNDGTRYFLQGTGGGIERATLRSNGGLANYSANNVNLASDIRLKKDITPLATTWNKVKEIEVVNFRYKDCNENDPLLYGVIAQQVQPIVPELVVVTRKAQEAQNAELDEEGKVIKEAIEASPDYYGIREQPMYWLAIKALQEAMERIETLEAKVAALESA